jgi:hypothetical protein
MSRQVCAIAFVVGLVLAVALSGALERQAKVADSDEGADGIDAATTMRALVQSDDKSLKGLWAEDALPDELTAEVALPVGSRDVRVSPTGTVIGCVVDGVSPQDVLADLRAQMKNLGWSCVPLGGLDGATFVKDGGLCEWALVTCTQTGQSTSVVIRCAVG